MQARIELSFDTDHFETVNVPFLIAPNYRRFVARAHVTTIEELLPQSAYARLAPTTRATCALPGGRSLSRKADSARNIRRFPTVPGARPSVRLSKTSRWPKIYYNYFCAISPAMEKTRVQVRSDVLRENRKGVPRRRGAPGNRQGREPRGLSRPPHRQGRLPRASPRRRDSRSGWSTMPSSKSTTTTFPPPCSSDAWLPAGRWSETLSTPWKRTWTLSISAPSIPTVWSLLQR